MRTFSTQAKFLLSSMCMYACFTLPVCAEENAIAAEQVIKVTPQPPLVEPQTIQSYEPKTPDDTTAADSVEEKKVSEGDNRTIGDTPQPPLVDPQLKPSYGPEIVDDLPEKDSIAPANKTVETSQEPEVDRSVEPGEAKEPLDTTEEDSITEPDKASTEKAEVKPEQKKQKKKWTETYPVSINADWLQLKSGEWLRGRITIMQKDSLEFDSDELKDLVIKWKNVKYLKSYGHYSLRFDSQGRTPIVGVIEVIGKKVHVKTDYDDQTYDRSDLLTIASGKETEISYWKNKVTFSINVRKGNTNQTDFTSKISAKRRTTDSRLVLDYLGNFTEVEDTETINNHRLNETYDIFLTRDLFWTPIFSEFFRDPFQNIDQRLNAGIGIGYSIINTNETEWDISAGPAYQQTKFVSVQQGTDQEDSTLTMALGTNFDTELNSKVDLEGRYSINLGDDKTGNYSHHSLLTIETELTDKLDFDVTAVWDHVRRPVTGQDGKTPEQDDFRIMIGLGYDL